MARRRRAKQSKRIKKRARRRRRTKKQPLGFWTPVRKKVAAVAVAISVATAAIYSALNWDFFSNFFGYKGDEKDTDNSHQPPEPPEPPSLFDYVKDSNIEIADEIPFGPHGVHYQIEGADGELKEYVVFYSSHKERGGGFEIYDLQQGNMKTKLELREGQTTVLDAENMDLELRVADLEDDSAKIQINAKDKDRSPREIITHSLQENLDGYYHAGGPKDAHYEISFIPIDNKDGTSDCLFYINSELAHALVKGQAVNIDEGNLRLDDVINVEKDGETKTTAVFTFIPDKHFSAEPVVESNLTEGESGSYTTDGQTYSVALTDASSKEINFTVNGEQLTLKQGESALLKDGSKFMAEKYNPSDDSVVFLIYSPAERSSTKVKPRRAVRIRSVYKIVRRLNKATLDIIDGLFESHKEIDIFAANAGLRIRFDSAEGMKQAYLANLGPFIQYSLGSHPTGARTYSKGIIIG